MNDERPSERHQILREITEDRRKSSVRSFETSVKYAEMYLKNCFILNGGAILAFPTMSQLSGISVHDHKIGFILSLSSLSFGLIASLISVASAAGWFERMMIASSFDAYILRRKIADKTFDINSADEYMTNYKMKQNYKILRFYASICIIFATISGLAFISGIITSGLVISELDLLFLSDGTWGGRPQFTPFPS